MKHLISLAILILCLTALNGCTTGPVDKSAAGRANALSAGQTALTLAEAGDPHYQYSLGLYYEQGNNGMNQDIEQAIHWYQAAAAQKYLPAYVRLGTLYEFGKGLSRDKNMAVAYYEAAALANMDDFRNNEYYPYIKMEIIFAQQQLGRLYATGDGIAPNHAKGYMWNRIVLAQNPSTGEPKFDKSIKEYQELAGLFNAILDSNMSLDDWKLGEAKYQKYLKDYSTWQKEYAQM